MIVDTKAAREFANELGYLDGTGPEVRPHLHNMADEIDRLRAQVKSLRLIAVRAPSSAYFKASEAAAAEAALERMADDARVVGLDYECHDGRVCKWHDQRECEEKCARLRLSR